MQLKKEKALKDDVKSTSQKYGILCYYYVKYSILSGVET